MSDNPIAGLIPRGSIGLKLLLVCVLVMIMAVPLGMVGLTLAGRQDRAHQVINEIGARAGGAQTLGGPVLLVPYTRTVLSTTTEGAQRSDVIRGAYLILPTSGDAGASVQVADRRRGIYRAAVYQADAQFHAEFDPAAAIVDINPGDQLNWSAARVVVFARDARAMRDAATISFDGGAPMAATTAMDLSVLPASLNGGARYVPENDPALQAFAAPAAVLAGGPRAFKVDSRLNVSGAQRFAIAAFAQNTTVSMRGNRRDASATGYFQSLDPLQVDAHGFAAHWRAPLSVNAKAVDLAQFSLQQLANRDMAVSFVSSDDLYVGVARAIAYGILFIGLVFLATLIFEAVSGKKAHPAQYILVGLAQCIFYLLLLSMTEIIGFDGAFLAGAAATIALLAYYAAVSARSAGVGAGAFAGLTALYGAMYVLLTLEDFALLAGSLVAFIAIAATMIATRRIDWYGRTAQSPAS